MKEQEKIIQGNGGDEASVTTEQTLVEMFLEQHYRLRRNILLGIVEYRKVEEDDSLFRPLTEEALNSIILFSKREMGEEVDIKADLKTYVNSEDIPHYDPVNTWLDALPEWDGVERVVPFWNRIPGLSAEQIYLLSIWMRYVVAQWMNISLEHGNEGVPVLIGDQGCNKSTFWIRFLPEHLREYYLDHFNLQNKFDKEMALTNCPLICLDEMDQYTPRQVIALKQALSKVKVNGRRIYGRTIDARRRYASFVGTTNNRHPLNDPTGSRRYICIEVPKNQRIDVDTPIEYDQLFAQLRHEITVDHARYWFTYEETLQIQHLNAPFEEQLDLEQMIRIYYKCPSEGSEKRVTSVTTCDIRHLLKAEYPNVPVVNFTSEKIGRTMKALDFPKKKTNTGVMYSVILRRTAS